MVLCSLQCPEEKLLILFGKHGQNSEKWMLVLLLHENDHRNTAMHVAKMLVKIMGKH